MRCTYGSDPRLFACDIWMVSNIAGRLLLFSWETNGRNAHTGVGLGRQTRYVTQVTLPYGFV